MVRIWGFHCRDPGSVLGRGTEILQAVRCVRKKKNGIKKRGFSSLAGREDTLSWSHSSWVVALGFQQKLPRNLRCARKVSGQQGAAVRPSSCIHCSTRAVIIPRGSPLELLAAGTDPQLGASRPLLLRKPVSQAGKFKTTLPSRQELV